MKTIKTGLAIGFLIMGLSFLGSTIPTEFVQHMVGMVLITLAILIWSK